MGARLTSNTLRQVQRHYRREFGLRAAPIDRHGRVATGACAPLGNRVFFRRARAHALGEAMRWGEPYTFFLAPGLMTWVAPLVDDDTPHGGLSGGEVRISDEAPDTAALIDFLVTAGVPRRAAAAYVGQTPLWALARARAAAAALFETFYQVSGWTPALLERRRLDARQQREIAEAIHDRKSDGRGRYPLEEERLLLARIRIGDRQGARRELNRLLAAIFLRSPRPAVIRARMIELMGYLVRAAVEDSPLLEPILERQHAWMERVLSSPDFESLCVVVRDALDDFMTCIFEEGFGRSNTKVRKALAYLAAHFAEPLRLEDVAAHVDLSTFRIAHMVKDYTGRTIMQHVKRLRIDRARHLIETTPLSCAAIAYAVGFADQSLFSRQFREMTGATPARYRRERHRLT